MGCEACGAPVDGKRRFCEDIECVRERARARKRKERGQVIEFPSGDDHGPVWKATYAKLAKADRLEEPMAQAALTLAARMDGGAKDTGSSVAAVARQLQAAIEDAMQGVAPEADALDALRNKVVRLVR